MDTKELTIQNLIVAVAVPYAEGHPLTAAEAKQLNQVRAENIRNNTAAAVLKLATVEGEGKDKKITYTPEAEAEARALIAKYDSEYVFSMTTAGPRRVVDPLEKECIAIARAHLTAAIKEAGGNVKDYDAEKIEAKIEEMAADPEVVKMAKARLAQRSKLADSLKLDLSSVGKAEATGDAAPAA